MRLKTICIKHDSFLSNFILRPPFYVKASSINGLRHAAAIRFTLPIYTCVPTFALIKDRFKNREPSINLRWEKRLFLPGRDDRFRQMRAAKCHRDGGLTRLSFTYPWWKAPGGRLTDGWRLPSFRLLRKMRKVRLGLVEAVRGQGLYQWSIMDQNPRKNKRGRGPNDKQAGADRGRKHILLFWGSTDNSAGQQLVAICVDKQSQWEFRLDTNHMLSFRKPPVQSPNGLTLKLVSLNQ